MRHATLKGACADIAAQARRGTTFTYAQLREEESAALAQIYLDAYPADIAAVNLEHACKEMDQTFAGTYGTLLGGACLGAYSGGRLIGGIFTVERSPWDPGLDYPFIIDLFLNPAWRSRGVGRELLRRCAAACQHQGHAELALRVGKGTSPAAFAIYRSLGMIEIDPGCLK